MPPLQQLKISRIAIVVLLSFGLHIGAHGQTVLGNDDVVRMVNLGISPSVVITKIKNTPCDFDTSIDALAALTKKKIPDMVISAMIEGCETDSGERVDPMLGSNGAKSLMLEGSPAPGTARRGDVPDVRFTPGAVLTTDAATVCVSGYSATVRNVSEATKNQIYTEYAITSHAPKEFEIDHDISLEIGGSNDPKNLWPQSYITTPWNAHVKDKLENYLHKLVCTDKNISLVEAQAQIRGDWRVAYVKYFGLPAGAAPLGPTSIIAPSQETTANPLITMTPDSGSPAVSPTGTPTPNPSPITSGPKRSSSSGSHTYIQGSRGGCYYLSGSGKKVYVDHALCQ